jgi:hypothetical protein
MPLLIPLSYVQNILLRTVLSNIPAVLYNFGFRSLTSRMLNLSRRFGTHRSSSLSEEQLQHTTRLVPKSRCYTFGHGPRGSKDRGNECMYVRLCVVRGNKLRLRSTVLCCCLHLKTKRYTETPTTRTTSVNPICTTVFFLKREELSSCSLQF